MEKEASLTAGCPKDSGTGGARSGGGWRVRNGWEGRARSLQTPLQPGVSYLLHGNRERHHLCPPSPKEENGGLAPGKTEPERF